MVCVQTTWLQRSLRLSPLHFPSWGFVYFLSFFFFFYHSTQSSISNVCLHAVVEEDMTVHVLIATMLFGRSGQWACRQLETRSCITSVIVSQSSSSSPCFLLLLLLLFLTATVLSGLLGQWVCRQLETRSCATSLIVSQSSSSPPSFAHTPLPSAFETILLLLLLPPPLLLLLLRSQSC